MPVHRRVVKLCYILTMEHQAAFKKVKWGKTSGTFKAFSEKIQYKRVSMMCYHHAKHNRIKNRNLLSCMTGVWEGHSRNHRDCLPVVGWWGRGEKDRGGDVGWGEEGRTLLGMSLWL